MNIHSNTIVTTEDNFLDMKPKGVAIQMNVLDEYLLMVRFMSSLKRLSFLANCFESPDREIW